MSSPRLVQYASCLVRELTSPRDVQSASWQSASWRIRELSSYRVVGLLGLQTRRGTVHVVVPTDKHVAVSRVGDGEQVRRHLSSTFALVLGDDVRSIDRQATVRVDDDAE